LSDIAQMRWLFGSLNGAQLDIVCSRDEQSDHGFVVSCKKFVDNIDEAYAKSGETAQRLVEANGLINAAGPVAGLRVLTFEPRNEPQIVWTLGAAKVSAIRSTHMPGHASYRVDTPAGSVVIGGDASNDVQEPPRKTSTSDQVEKLAKDADIIVHTAIHPVLSPDRGSGAPPVIYNRQSNATDLGAMAQRAGAKYLMLTHLTPPLGAKVQGIWPVPGGPLTEDDYKKAARDGGYTGTIVAGTDLSNVRLPKK